MYEQLKSCFWIWVVKWYVNWMYDCNYTPYRCLWVCLCNRGMMERWWWKASWISPGGYGDPSGWKYRMRNRCFPLLLWSPLTPAAQSARSETRGCFWLLHDITNMSTTRGKMWSASEIFAFTGPSFSGHQRHACSCQIWETCDHAWSSIFDELKSDKEYYTNKFGPKNSTISRIGNLFCF